VLAAAVSQVDVRRVFVPRAELRHGAKEPKPRSLTASCQARQYHGIQHQPCGAAGQVGEACTLWGLAGSPGLALEIRVVLELVLHAVCWPTIRRIAVCRLPATVWMAAALVRGVHLAVQSVLLASLGRPAERAKCRSPNARRTALRHLDHMLALSLETPSTADAHSNRSEPSVWHDCHGRSKRSALGASRHRSRRSHLIENGRHELHECQNKDDDSYPHLRSRPSRNRVSWRDRAIATILMRSGECKVALESQWKMNFRLAFHRVTTEGPLRAEPCFHVRSFAAASRSCGRSSRESRHRSRGISTTPSLTSLWWPLRSAQLLRSG